MNKGVGAGGDTLDAAVTNDGAAGGDGGSAVFDAAGIDAQTAACVGSVNYSLRPGSTHRYRYESSGIFYDEAQAACAADGARLAIIDDLEENVYVAALAAGGAPWIGLNDYAQEGDFRWLGGGAIAYSNWSGGEPNDSGGDEDCVLLQGGVWNDGECSNNREFVCECDPSAPAPAPPSCMMSASYSQVYQGRRYRMSTDATSYELAKASCDSEGGHLVVVTDETENDYVRNMISGDTWIGYDDVVTEGVFRWVSGSNSVYTKWALFQPDDFSAGEDCVQISNSGEWNDLVCGNSLVFICECDPDI